MALGPGSRIGPYEVTALLGEGGMGKVWRAHHIGLKRDDALKVLPDAFASDPERLARFQREAQVLASLNHPNIAHVHGLEQADGVRALVMELVEGPTLADRIAQGPVPVDEALPIAKQIAEALEAAHEQGIIHRDLKPANIKVRPDGTVKVLDFGLAKALEPMPAGDATASPTITSPAMMTGVGVLLGTAAYMSPEQARGKAVDKRSDIWAFGCVLYEMLAGQRAFAGEDVTDTLAAVVRAEPAWDVLPDDLPPSLRMFLRRCLQKNPKQRLHDMADMRLALEGAFETAVSQTATPVAVAHLPRWLRVAILTVGTVVIGAVGAAIAVVGWRNTTDATKVSFEVQANSGGVASASMIALSPDGRNLLAVVPDDEGVNRLWVRPIDRVIGVTPQGTEAAGYPFWSPDGRYIGFFADGKLKKVDILGAPPDSLSDATAGRGGTWNRDGVILFAPEASGPLFRIAASGGQPVQVTALNKTRSETAHRFPRFLPDGVHFLYLVVSSQTDETGIFVGSLNSKDTKRLVATTANAEFAAPDLLLFLRDSTLMAQRFDTSRLELSGDPFQVAEQVGSGSVSGLGGFTASENGVLAYRTGTGGARTLAWVDRSGKVEGSIGTPARYENPRLSPDAKRLAVFKPDGGGDIWITDLERGSSTRFTFDPATDQDPVWSPDGAQLAFVSNRNGSVFNLYQKSAGGTGNDELLLKTPNNKWIDDWSADGRFIVYHEEDPNTKADLWVLPLFGDRKPMRLLGTPFNERYASFSPDGRWIAYTSDEGGRLHVYVQAFPSADRKWQVSTIPTRNNAYPRWRPDGKELFYDSGGTMTAVELIGTQPGGEFRVGVPQELFRGLMGGLPPHNYDVTPGGRRFLIVSAQDPGAGPTPIVVVVNWTSGLTP